MSILRIILFSALFYLLYRVLRYFLSSAEEVDASEKPTLLSCVQCATWIPQGSALRRAGKIYCSEKCAEPSSE